MTQLRTFHLVEAKPHPLVAQALNAELFAKCRIERPVPVHFLPMPRWGGRCPAMEDTRDGELHFADSLLNPEKNEQGMCEHLVLTYLHELAHRLTPGHWHDPAFLAVNLLLAIRAGNKRFDRPWLWNICLYDMQDWQDIEYSSVGEALDWSYKQADELSSVDLSAESCAAEIMRRFNDWKAWKSATPKRAAEEQLIQQKNASLIQGLKEEVARLKQARWNWFSGGIVAGMLINLIFFVLAKGV